MANPALIDYIVPIISDEEVYNATVKLLSFVPESSGSAPGIDAVQDFLLLGQPTVVNYGEYPVVRFDGFEWIATPDTGLLQGWLLLGLSDPDKSNFEYIALDACLGIWAGGTAAGQFNIYNYQVYADRWGEVQFNTLGITDVTENDYLTILGHFIKNTLYVGVTASRSIEDQDQVITQYALFIAARLQIWHEYYLSNNQTINESDLAAIDELESAWLAEQNFITNPDLAIESTLGDLGFENLLKIAEKGFSATRDASPLAAMLGKVFSDKIGNVSTSTFGRAFSNVKIEEIQQMDETVVRSLMLELEALGILDLLSFADQIINFAKKRAKSTTTIQKSALEYIDEATDIPWLVKLIEVDKQLRQSPIILFKLNYYFPSVMAFILDALAVTADYSNGGLGGGREDDVNDPSVFLDTLEKAFGTRNGEAVFELAVKADNTAQRLDRVLKRSPFRDNTSPLNPDMFHLRLGAANFYVPPITIDINTAFKAGSVMSGALRQKNSPKFNSGYRETIIKLRLFFPNYQEIWGMTVGNARTIDLNAEFKIDFRSVGDSDDKIDKFLSSLRGLVAAFKYSPFVPVKNHYLNSVHGITAVGYSNMTISTIPNFPFALAVDLELVNFNHKPFLPMISDFNQAMHWGKYRQYMGKAAGHLANYVNEEFLLKTSDVKEEDQSGSPIFDTNDALEGPVEENFVNSTVPYKNDTLKTRIVQEWTDGNHLTLFVPAETQTKLYLPSASTFRTDEEKIITDLSTSTWNSLLKWVGIDINESASYGLTLADTLDVSRENAYSKSAAKTIRNSIDMIIAGMNSDTEAERTYQSIVVSFIGENSKLTEEERNWLKDYEGDITQYPAGGSWIFQGKFLSGEDYNTGEYVSLNSIKWRFIQIAKNPKAFLDLLISADYSDRLSKAGDLSPDREMVKQDVIRAFNVSLYEKFMQSGPIQSLLEAARRRAGAALFNEWEVPMLRVDLDPEKVIINGVTISLGNILVKLQVQMHDEPTYQHVGGKDSFISISMTVIGETELIKLKKIFDHISGLARLEHASGVIGFLGIKNIITALAGIKYVMPLNYSVNTRPNYPHVYDVQLSLVDFDIFQQKREELSNRQQKDLIEHFGSKKNPFLRIKQLWGSFNAYPDFPLSIKDEAGEVVGCLDPDFYFRSFEMFDKDVVYNITQQNPISESYIFDDIYNSLSSDRINEIREKIRQTINDYIQSKITDIGEHILGTPTDSVSVVQILADWVRAQNDITVEVFLKIFYDVISSSSDNGFISESILLRTEFMDLSGFEYDQFDTLAPERIAEITEIIKDYTAQYAATKDQAELNPIEYISVAVDLYLLVESLTDITKVTFLRIFNDAIAKSSDGEFILNGQLLRDEYGAISGATSESDPYYMQELPGGKFGVGQISPRDSRMAVEIEAALAGDYNLASEEEISFHPDEVTFFKQIFIVPSGDQTQISANQASAILQTSLGTYYGYVNKENGRFYLTSNGVNALKRGSNGLDDYSWKFAANPVEDAQTPDKGTTKALSGAFGATPLSEYQKPYQGDVASHWEKMMLDTSYRDSSGRMIRAFPTYMLWLIDEGGYFAGVKLFDNFYGLQSIIDFSVVSSEDLLGDTLIFRLSNLYSKLTRKETTQLFNTSSDSVDGTQTMAEGLGAIIERTLNMSRNLKSGLKNDYVVDISSIRLKPGVRVHLRAGYGSNPNSLQTLFNGVITNVEQGEIVTVTAQSDAIELGAIVNSTKKNADSGKIDGGIDTGFYLSEPRDLMVRLLTMGSSRTKEAFARATRGTVFSENKFGIRHFGTILYEPLSDQEIAKNEAVGKGVSGAFTSIGGGRTTGGFSFNLRGATLDTLSTLWANFGNQVDLEIYKRNIYPGNGLGIAQFMGGDTDDGWATVASFDEGSSYNDRTTGYLGRLTDVAYNNMLVNYQDRDLDSSKTIGALTAPNRLISAEGRAGAVAGAVGVAVTAATAIINPIAGLAAGAGLLGVLSGRGGTNVFRTMGIISPNADDDLQGFDEVSFRASTYMRTVWDLFQVCARLLPNYIVAVRPFEDRSTVFYGKPHWLYTSGVIPLTTGYPTKEKAIELGISPGPDTVQPDETLAKIYDAINRDTNPLSDYAAFFQAKEPANTFTQLSIDMVKSGGIYAPSSKFLGKIINFYSKGASEFIALDTKCKLPISKGKVYIGPHLPVIKVDPESNITTPIVGAPLDMVEELHKQIGNLPPRYSFPYFAINENAEIKNSATIVIKPVWEIYSTNGYKPFEYNKLEDITKLEIAFHQKNKFTLMPSEGDGTLAGSINLDTPLDFSGLRSDVEGTYSFNASVILMPLPRAAGFTNFNEQYNSDDYSFELDTSNYTLPYTEWAPPSDPMDEQFYIAMRWPYLPPTDDPNTIAKFKSEYGFEDIELVGTAADYQNRKVLVYNPSNGRAVVCKPAFFMWGGKEDVVGAYVGGGNREHGYDALVSPDAAYFLSIITYNQEEAEMIKDGMMMIGNTPTLMLTVDNSALDFDDEDIDNIVDLVATGYREAPLPQECYFAFVPTDIPVGVLSPSIVPINKFTAVDASGVEISTDADSYIVGFGKFGSKVSETTSTTTTVDGLGNTQTNTTTLSETHELYAQQNPLGHDYGEFYLENFGNSLDVFHYYQPYNLELIDAVAARAYGGNPLNVSDNKSYFQLLLEGGDKLDQLSEEDLTEIRKTESNGEIGANRQTFIEVYDPADQVSFEARQFYDEKFDPNVSVIAGNGRNLQQAQEIWDRFRAGYHTYESVKAIFARIYGLDPDSTDEFPPMLKSIMTGEFNVETNGLQDFSASGGNANDEFEILFGRDYLSEENNPGGNVIYDRLQAIEFMRENLIDAPASQNGLLAYLNDNLSKVLTSVHTNFFEGDNVKSLEFLLEANQDKTLGDVLTEAIKTPKQLFLFMVGIFRQRMWEDPYARAWLVLRPDKKHGVDSGWSFRPVDKIFMAFIDPYQDYAKESKKDKFRKLLASTRGEGNNNTSFMGEAIDDVSGFLSATIGPVVSAMSDAMTGMLSMFKMSMQQLGYALSEVGNFKKQANILNKAFNDSIYYSLGRPGSILRAADNPFTREYGEPVLEIREPFQRLHYISSFSHIISNQIQENITGVATSITAVSDGKYPVTVALDKGAPAERQVERTVETGILFDNVMGSGMFTGMLHPFMHPLETARGASKMLQGAPDELSAKRIALAHLKESIKDIYGGELIVIGNTDIRPHDLVYLSDVYERMYGMFEVEQVVHHFTPELGFITSITPNALVTVNDPARWYKVSWLQSWMHVQSLRNDTRIMLDNIRSGSSGLMVGGNISIDRLGEVLSPQLVGGFQFTHGSSALVRDIISSEIAKDAPSKFEKMISDARDTGDSVGFASFLRMVPLVGPVAWKGWKWIRDNVLDQHGCYVQYLNKNGQPMDAGLSYNQGMVVGQHHSTKLLPGLLGASTKTRSPEGHAFIRSDDLFKSLGWNETQISDLTRFISYETALTQARVLNMSGLGPEKATFQWKFKVIGHVIGVIDGDTIDVVDIISGALFRVRFDGMNAAETNIMSAGIGNIDGVDGNANAGVLDLNTPGGIAKMFTKNAIENKIVVLKLNQTRTPASNNSPRAVYDWQFEAGAVTNIFDNYALDIFSRSQSGEVDDGTPRALATIFYHFTEESFASQKAYISNIFREKINNLDSVLQIVKNDIYEGSPFYVKFDTIFEYTSDLINLEFYDITNNSDPLYSISEDYKKLLSRLIHFKMLQELYDFVSRWPEISWDEYFSDGYPATLNWELIVNNLAKVFVKDLQKESESVQTSYEIMANLNRLNI
jgi:hypothetical protein